MTVSLIVDFETTGLLKPSSSALHEQPKAIELGIIKVESGTPACNNAKVGLLITEHSWLINPGEPITAEITKITSITNDMLAPAPRFHEVYQQIVDVFVGADNFIAHNAPFDKGILDLELRRIELLNVALPPDQQFCSFPMPPNIVCTIAEFRHLYGRNMKLTELHEKVTGVLLKQEHRALSDCRAVLAVLQGGWVAAVSTDKKDGKEFVLCLNHDYEYHRDRGFGYGYYDCKICGHREFEQPIPFVDLFKEA